MTKRAVSCLTLLALAIATITSVWPSLLLAR